MRSIHVTLAVAAIACTGAFLAACGSDDSSSGGSAATATPSATDTGTPGKIARNVANSEITLTIGSKNFTEQKVLGEIYAQGLAAAGYTVKTDLNLGDEVTALKALKGGDISAYPEYTGTALLSFFGKKADQLPKSPQAAYEEARQGFAAEKPPLVAYPPTPFTSSNEVAVTKETAAKYDLKNISDLAKVASKLTLYGSPECRKRLDCLLGLQQVYGLKFKKFTPVDVAQRHDVLKTGRADISIVFTTDPQIKREGEVLLKDDKGMFPPYNSTLVVRKDVSDKAGPDLGKTVKILQEQLTAENMQELNARVDLDKKDAAEVAKEYLQETGLTSGS
jgi:osmoprotectant transport system substrate-binding protein